MKFPVCFLFASLLLTAARIPEPPKLRLPGDVRPIRYSIDLTVVPDRDTFRGAAEESIDIGAPTSIVWINASALHIEDVSFRSSEGAETHPKVVDGGDSFVGLSFDRPVSGSGVLRLAYEGKISRNSSAGLFQLKEGGQWYVYSQCEPTDARRAFPCFDEPGFKTPWQLTLHVPAGNGAFANTPQMSETKEAAGMKTVRFEDTKPLPSYLVALAVGPFDIVDAGKAGKTPLRVIVPHGKKDEARFAAESIPQLLKLLENYFGIPYPYKKLDSVVMPISDFAMENVGLITYGESLLLSKPENDTIDRQRTCAYVVAHEMAHQWFGDLVTTGWWDDIWLNEAFATWMERKITGEWKPEWNADALKVDSKLGAMRLDSLLTARKIRQPIESDSDIANAFDDITYEKGAAVIQMFEAWIGPEKFRKGVELYLNSHANGNATARDFEAAISSAAGQDIAPAFDTFLNQAGLPEVSVSLDCSAEPRLRLSQKRYLPIGSKPPERQLWKVPVCVEYESGGQIRRECSLLSDSDAVMPLYATSCPEWVQPDAAESGYYRVAYQGDLLNNLLTKGRSHLTVAERVGILGDVDALVDSGDVSPKTALALVPEFAKDPAEEVVEQAIGIAGLVKGRSIPDDLRPAGVSFVRQVFGARASELGWRKHPGESATDTLLRPALVPFVATTGEQKNLIDEAGKLARRWLDDRSAIDPDMVGPALRVAAEFGDRALFDRFHTEAVKSKNPRERQTILRAMGSFRNPEIARAAMAVLLTGEFDMRQAFRPLLFGAVAYKETRDLPFEFVQRNLEALLSRLPREVGEDFAAFLRRWARAFATPRIARIWKRSSRIGFRTTLVVSLIYLKLLNRLMFVSQIVTLCYPRCLHSSKIAKF